MFLCHLRSIAAHRDHFVRRLSVCACVCLSDSHTFLIVMHSYVWQATHAFLGMLPLCFIFVYNSFKYSCYWYYLFCSCFMKEFFFRNISAIGGQRSSLTQNQQNMSLSKSQNRYWNEYICISFTCTGHHTCIKLSVALFWSATIWTFLLFFCLMQKLM